MQMQISMCNFCSFKGVNQVAFMHPLSAIIGPNGCGKTNLTEALLFCLLQNQKHNLRDYVCKFKDSSLTYVELKYQNSIFRREILSAGSDLLYFDGALLGKVDYQQKIIEKFNFMTNLSPKVSQNEAAADFSSSQLSVMIEAATGKPESKQQFDALSQQLEEQRSNTKLAAEKFSQLKKRTAGFVGDKEIVENYQKLEQQIEKQQNLNATALLLDCTRQIQQNAEQQTQMENQVKQLQQQGAGAATETAKIEQQYQQAEIKKLNVQKQIEKLDSKIITDLQPKYLDLESQKKLGDKKLTNLQLSLGELRNQQKFTVVELEQLKAEAAILQKDLDKNQSSVVIPPDYQQFKEKFESQNTQELNALQKQQSELKLKQKDVKKLEEQLISFKSQISETSKTITGLTEKLNSHEADLWSEQRKQEDLQKQIGDLSKELKSKQADLSATQQKHSLILSQIDHNQLFQVNIQKVRQRQSVLSKVQQFVNQRVFGYFSDLVEATAQDEQNVVDYLLQGYSNHVVVETFDNIQTALQEIRKIKQRVNFIPLGNMKQEYQQQLNEDRELSFKFEEQFPKQKLKPAFDVVKFSQNFAPVVAYVLRNTFVLIKGDIQAAEQFSKQNRVRVITKDCVLFTGGGIISAQIGQEQTENLSTKQVMSLETQRQQLENQLIDLNETIFALDTKRSILKNQELPSAQSLVAKYQQQMESAQQQIYGKQKLLEELQQSYKNLNQEYENTKVLLIKDQQICDQKQESFLIKKRAFFKQYLTDRQIKDENYVEKIEYYLNEGKDSENHQKLFALQQKIAILSARGFWQDIERLVKLQGVFNEQNSQISKNIQLLQLQKDEIDKEKQALILQLKEQQIEAKALFSDLQRAQSGSQQYNKQLNQFDNESKQLQQAAEKLEQKLNKILERIYVQQIQIVSGSLSVQETADSIKSYFTSQSQRDVYQFVEGLDVDYKQFDKKTNLQLVASEAEHQLVQLQTQISRVNPNFSAMGQLQDLEQQLEQAQIQLQEAKQAQIALQGKFNSIQTQRATAFNKVIEDLNPILQTVYGDLTEEQGKLFLQVSDPVQPFDPEYLDLLVQPPGDTIRTLQHLSGGERALARLAITISIMLLLKYVFVVLDESESALDEGKVRNLGQLYCKISDSGINGHKIKVISVTHNSQLAEFASFVVGVSRKREDVESIGSKIFWISNAV